MWLQAQASENEFREGHLALGHSGVVHMLTRIPQGRGHIAEAIKLVWGEPGVPPAT